MRACVREREERERYLGRMSLWVREKKERKRKAEALRPRERKIENVRRKVCAQVRMCERERERENESV